ncbi:MAG TPA: glycosyltransferase family 4 protein [Gaiellaceae bacterium]|nr:glycosyltransferase family 4 protein [Gaiellaceae bacterium]
MRRLCMVVHGPYPLAEPRVEREAQAALAAGWSVDVVAATTPGAAAEEVCDGVRVCRLPVTHVRGGSLRSVVAEYARFTTLASLELVRRLRGGRYDVVHVHNPPDFLFAAALLPKLAGSSAILDVHDFAPELFAMRMAGRRLAAPAERILRALERQAARLSDAVVTVHEPYRRELVRRGVDPRKLVTVMNTLDERFAPDRPGPPAAGPRIVSHGTITEHYGLDLLVDAVRRVRALQPEMRVELYGDGDALPRVRERVEALGLDDAFAIEGRYLPLGDVLRRVAGASIGVVCNRPIERNLLAVPTKLFEYVALGIPVVSADLPAVAEHFSADEVAYFAAGDAESLSDALQRLLADPAAARAQAQRALARYEEYRWARNAERYVALLDRLVRSRAGTPATTAPGSTSAVTTAPAPTSAPAPTRTPPSTIAPEPRLAPRSTTVGSSSQSSSD